MCVCVCVCVRERERACVYERVCVWLLSFDLYLCVICAGWSCAALEDVCREAGMRALRRDLTAGTVTWADIAEARGGASGALAGLRL
ncbi:MAG: hypothetical protein P4L40_15555 [Terracidiphilus sp.]|nr:hypothetical protein [Terracidiphilus sp.]